MFNKYKIIVDKARTEEKILMGFYSLKEMAIMLVAGFAGFQITKILLSDVYALVIGVGLFAVFGMLFFELSNHLNIWQCLKLLKKYYVDEKHSSYYYPLNTTSKYGEEENYVTIQEIRQEKIKHKKKKRKTKGKYL